tara:strand:- start:316 stop:444 length:129 start_codon:yes stop_codon:yes gene_type:complete
MARNNNDHNTYRAAEMLVFSDKRPKSNKSSKKKFKGMEVGMR